MCVKHATFADFVNGRPHLLTQDAEGRDLLYVFIGPKIVVIFHLESDVTTVHHMDGRFPDRQVALGPYQFYTKPA